MQRKYLALALLSLSIHAFAEPDDKPQLTPPPKPKATIPANILADVPKAKESKSTKNTRESKENKDSPASKELKNLKNQIASEQKKLQAKQAQQLRNQEILRQTQIAIAAARRELDELNRQQRISWNKLQELQNRLSQLQTEVENTKAQIARLLVGNYKNKQPSAVVAFLHNASAAQKSRFLQYSRRINEANDEAITKLKTQQQELEQQETQIHKELERLKQLAAVQQNKLRQLGQSHQAALADTQKLNGEISLQNNKIHELRENEKQLSQVLAQIVAKRAEQRKAEAAERQKAAKQRNETAQTNSKSAHATAQDTSFSKLQGTLRRPVSGSIAGRFGQARNGGGIWRGIFIATSPASVQSIAAGEVAYATTLRGYGNTVIIDHGDGYLSVYTGLNSIGVSVGEKVSARQNVGMSGTLPTGEQGLYFEIRYRNRAMNPLAWVK